MDCIDLTSKQSKMLRYVAKHSKLRKTTKVIKLQWIASIWCQKDQTNAKLQKWSYFNELGSIWPQNDQKRWGTSQNIQNNGKLQNWSITMNCIDLTKRSKRSKTSWGTSQNYKSDQIIMDCIDLTSKRLFELGRNTTKVIKSIWHQNNQKCWDTSQNIQNYAKLRKWSNYNELHRFDVKKIKRKLKSDIISMNLIDLTSKRSKQRKTKKWSDYNALHRFDV